MIRCMWAALWFGDHGEKVLKIDNENSFQHPILWHQVRAECDCVAKLEDDEMVHNFVGRRTCCEDGENAKACTLRFGTFRWTKQQ